MLSSDTAPDFAVLYDVASNKSRTFDNNGGLLPPAADSTGTHSLYTSFMDYEIMFHVSTLLPYTPNNKQQVKVEPQAGPVSGERTRR